MFSSAVSRFLVTLATSCLFFAGLACPAQSKAGDSRRWTNRLIPLPKEVAISEFVAVPPERIFLCPESSQALPVLTARQRLAGLARCESEANAQIFIRLCLAADAGADLPAALSKRLQSLPNQSQAYAIHNFQDQNGKRRFILVGNTPTGILYAARTFGQLLKMPAAAPAGMKVDIPIVEIMDWPDMANRGYWGGSAKFDFNWFGDWKLNTIRFNPYPVCDDKGHGTFARSRPQIDALLRDASASGINAIPFVSHLAGLSSEAGIRRAIYDPKLKPLLDILGKPLESDNGICLTSPATVSLISDWLMQMAEMVSPYHDQVEVWLTEMDKHYCRCPECSKYNSFLLETKVILTAFEQVKKRHPNMHLWIFLSQGSDRANVHDEIIKMAQNRTDVGLMFYSSDKTYVSDRKLMIPENLFQYSARGGQLGVVPQLNTNWCTMTPWVGPQFVKFRTREFTDKKLNSIAAYTVPGWMYSEFNLMAMAEWTWNAKGRNESEFAEAYATVRGLSNPGVFADWALKAGRVGWDLAEPAFFAMLNWDPSVGLPQGMTVEEFFKGCKLVDEAWLRDSLKIARAACALADGTGNPDMRNESDIDLAGLQTFQLLKSVTRKLRETKLTREEKSSLAEELDRLDVCAGTIGANLLDWGVRNTPADPDYTSGVERLTFALEGCYKNCSLLRGLAATHGISDARPQLREIKVGEWTTDNFKSGLAKVRFDLTDRLGPHANQWRWCCVRLERQQGCYIFVTDIAFLQENEITHTRKSYPQVSVWNKLNPHKMFFVLPAPRLAAGDKIVLEVSLQINAPLGERFPDKTVAAHDAGTFGSVFLQGVMEPRFMNGLTASKVTEGADELPLIVTARKKGEPIRVAVLSGLGAVSLMRAINQDQNLKARLVTELNAKILLDSQVIIIAQQDKPANLLKYMGLIDRWVNNGGGVLFLHDAVGYRGHPAFFRAVGVGTDNPKLSKVKVSREHPITRGLVLNSSFSHAYLFDHVILQPGVKGTVVIKDEQDQPVVVAGEVGGGRVILDGMLSGCAGLDKGGQEGEPSAEERRLLVNAIDWLAGPANLLPDPGAENPVLMDGSADKRAAGWGFYHGSGRTEWGLTDKEAHSGRHSVFLKFKEYQALPNYPYAYNAAIVVGGGDGGTGAAAIDVEPNQSYGFSLWMKGDATWVSIQPVTWLSREATPAERRFNHPINEPINLHVNGVLASLPDLRAGKYIVPTPKAWTRYSGTFHTPPGARKAAILVRLNDESGKLTPGQGIFLDDASVFPTF